LNVRTGPGKEFKAMTALKDETAGVLVTGVSGLWLRISGADNVEGKTLFGGTGWVYGPLIGISARNKTRLLAEPRRGGALVGTIPADEGGVVTSCRGEWVQIEYKKIKGWIEPGSYCGSPVTTCP
jgi:SH3-like domain-containing protein